MSATMEMNTPAQALQVTPQRIMQFAWGYAAPLILESAIRNKVFDTLDAGPKTVDEVHAATGASTRGLTAIMNALVGFEFLDKDAHGRYSLTPESAAFLVSTKPSFQGGMLAHTSEQLMPKWLNLSEIVRTGKTQAVVNQQDSGAAFFEKLVPNIFNMSYPAAQVLAGHLHLDKAHVLDLATGSGVWGIALAQSSPNVRVSVVDWPSVLEITKKIAAKFGVGDRFSYIPGDLSNVDFGSGYNVATLGHILHSEGEAKARKLLRKTFEALATGGTIAIAEFLVNNDRKGPTSSLIFAVNMFINTDNGDTYSFEEISQWLREAGFTNPRQLDSPGPSPLILATKP
ncbi:MAG TPA: methyltransferase [Silvibacterium sp.]|nr:methyltransferase [Silvibacterium sp.]